MPAIPNTNTFKLTEVVAATGGGNSLISAFANAVPVYFESAYMGNRDGQINFRNYCGIYAFTISTINIEEHGATVYCQIESDGVPTILSKGVCCSTSPDPTISNTVFTYPEAGLGFFSIVLFGLLNSMKYYIRAYVAKGSGVAYGYQLEFITGGTSSMTMFLEDPYIKIAHIGIPSQEVGSTSISLVYKAESASTTITKSGLIYSSINKVPSFVEGDSSVTENISGDRYWCLKISGLIAGVTYYVRSWALNSFGYAYSPNVEIVTTVILDRTYPGVGDILGGGLVIEVNQIDQELEYLILSSAYSNGYCNFWTARKIAEDLVQGGYSDWHLPSYTQLKEIRNILQVNNLYNFPLTVAYYTREYEEWGWIAPFRTYNVKTLYFNDQSDYTFFNCNNDDAYGLCVRLANIHMQESSIPELSFTTAVYDITGSSAKSGGTITSNQGSTIIEIGLCWNTVASPTIGNNKAVSGTAAVSPFTGTMSSLTAGTTYYVRAYATNSIGTGYGPQVNFNTVSSSAIPPTVKTNAVSDINDFDCICGGWILSDGGSFITEKGLCWGRFDNPTRGTGSQRVFGTGSDSFSGWTYGELYSKTLYYIRAYAVNSAGTGYGPTRAFTTTDNGMIFQ